MMQDNLFGEGSLQWLGVSFWHYLVEIEDLAKIFFKIFSAMISFKDRWEADT